eukprot:SAG31_NODE_117_length_24022_cov_6.878067_7_plen_148_part_00
MFTLEVGGASGAVYPMMIHAVSYTRAHARSAPCCMLVCEVWRVKFSLDCTSAVVILRHTLKLQICAHTLDDQEREGDDWREMARHPASGYVDVYGTSIDSRPLNSAVAAETAPSFSAPSFSAPSFSAPSFSAPSSTRWRRFISAVHF